MHVSTFQVFTWSGLKSIKIKVRESLLHDDNEDPQMLDGTHFRVQYCEIKQLRDVGREAWETVEKKNKPQVASEHSRILYYMFYWLLITGLN